MRRLALILALAVPAACTSSSSSPPEPSAVPDASTDSAIANGGDASRGGDAPSEFDSGPGDPFDGGSSRDGGDAGPTGACSSAGDMLSAGPCQTPAIQGGNVPSGCAPSVDGALYMSEWQDAACFVVGNNNMAVYVKYAGDAVYLATIGNPTCGCPMSFSFLPSGGTTIGPDEFTIGVFDDAFGKDGDRVNGSISNGNWVNGTAPPAGIVTACPGNAPTPMPYEWKIPFAALQITAGTAHTFRMAILHSAVKWPSGLTLNTNQVPDDPSSWGTFVSASNWR